MSRKPVIFPEQFVWDGETEATVSLIREVMYREPEPTISLLQAKSIVNLPANHPLWVSPQIIPIPENENIRQALFDTIDCMGKIDYDRVAWAPVQAEWVAWNTGIDHKSNETSNPQEAFMGVRSGLKSPLVILYVHGGAFFQGSAGNSRLSTGRLSNTTGGICFSIDYRLSPQNTFPAALMDLILAYLELLYPGRHSLHSPVAASNIVLAGDSAGANLCLSLVQFILHTKSRFRNNTAIFRAQSVTLPLPAAIASLSLFADPTYSLPSHSRNMKYDLFSQRTPWSFPDYPSCEIWPVRPSRANFYCHDLSNCHPLINLAMANSWKGSPPVLLLYGEEQLVDGGRVVAQNCLNDGVVVIWKEYSTMPHCFPLIRGLKRSKQVVKCWEHWTEFIKQAAIDPTIFNSHAIIIDGNIETQVDIKIGSKSLLGIGMDLEEANNCMKNEMENTYEWFQQQQADTAKL